MIFHTSVTFIKQDKQIVFNDCPIPRVNEYVTVMNRELHENVISIEGKVIDIEYVYGFSPRIAEYFCNVNVWVE